MPYDVQIRINGIVRNNLTAESLDIGYAFPRKFAFSETGVDHDAGSLFLSNNNAVEVSDNGFKTLLFAGYLRRVSPLGISREGVSYTAFGFEETLNRFIAKKCGRASFSYNAEQHRDLQASNKGSEEKDSNNIEVKQFYWTLGEMIIDVLEEAFGTPDEGSSIPHIRPFQTEGWFDQSLLGGPLLWSPAHILDLDFTPGGQSFSCIHLWDLLQRLVSKASSHGIFIDPTFPNQPRFFLHDWRLSTRTFVYFGKRGIHVQENEVVIDPFTGLPKVDPNTGLPITLPEPNVVSSRGPEFDLNNVINRVIVEGRPQVVKGAHPTQMSLAGEVHSSEASATSDVDSIVWDTEAQDCLYNGWEIKFTSGKLTKQKQLIVETENLGFPLQGVGQTLWALKTSGTFSRAPENRDRFAMIPPLIELEVWVDNPFANTSDGRVWRVMDCRFMPLVAGDDLDKSSCEVTGTRDGTVQSQAGFGPQFWVRAGGTWLEWSLETMKGIVSLADDANNGLYTGEVEVYLEHGIFVILDNIDLREHIDQVSGKAQIRAYSFYEMPFTVSVGPSGTAYDRYGIVREMCIHDDDFVHPSRLVDSRTPVAKRAPDDNNSSS